MTQPTPAALDRRDSPRVPVRFRVRTEGAAGFREGQGLLGVNGLLWRDADGVAASQRVELRLSIPGEQDEVPAEGELLLPRGAAEGGSCPIRFTALATRAELAIAQYLDDVAVGWE